MMTRRTVIAGALTLAMAGAVGAQPSTTPLEPSQLDTGSSVREVHSFIVPSPGAGPDYRIGILVPEGTPPAEGWPVLYMLDGQAVMERLTDDVLARIPKAEQKVIVTLGYDTKERFATSSRARDYTPPDPQGREITDPRTKTPAGHADAFWRLLIGQIVPRAETYAPIDSHKRKLWGHSYGGLFVLYASSQSDSPFDSYISASPALWWDNGKIGPAFEEVMKSGSWPKRPLELDIGSAERQKARDPGTDATKAFVKMRGALDPNALDNLVKTARASGIPGDFVEYPGLSHGQSFLASLYRAVGLPQ